MSEPIPLHTRETLEDAVAELFYGAELVASGGDEKIPLDGIADYLATQRARFMRAQMRDVGHVFGAAGQLWEGEQPERAKRILSANAYRIRRER